MDFFKRTGLAERGVKSGSFVRKAIEHLYDVKLPNRGLLSGGALAGLLYQLKKGDNLTHAKDVDIFIERNLWDRIAKPIKSGGAVLGDWVSGSSGQSISVTLKNKKETVPLIADVRQEGVLEFIETDLPISKDPLKLLELFDLNCDEVALDLSNERIYASEGFFRFINNGEIIAHRFNNLEKTCPRYCYKHEKYGLELGSDVTRLQNALFVLQADKGNIKCDPDLLEWSKSVINLVRIHAPAMAKPVELSKPYSDALVKSGKFGFNAEGRVVVAEDFKPNEKLLKSWKETYSWENWLTALELGGLPLLPELPKKLPNWVIDNDI